MTRLPWVEAAPLEAEAFEAVRRRTLFECCKWDPQVEDVSTLSNRPLVLAATAWRHLAGLAERLAEESLLAERELLERPDLHGRLGLPRSVRRALREAAGRPSAGVARVHRFDFHFTAEGWRLSEVNSDVPGGFVEGSGFAERVAPHYPDATIPGDPAGAYADALARALGAGSTIGMVHATAYADDRQVMAYLAKRLEAIGASAALVAPDQVAWRDGCAEIEAPWFRGPADALVRFFPAEWLPALPRGCDWKRFYAGARTPLSNPAGAILVQSKRFPLVWDSLRTPLPAWRSLLPETRDPREAPVGANLWVLKPALGRVGEGVGIAGETAAAEWRKIVREARQRPGDWAAQRRFTPLSLKTEEGEFYPCVGLFAVEGRACGAYGRWARRPLIDGRAQDVAVLVERNGEAQPHGS